MSSRIQKELLRMSLRGCRGLIYQAHLQMSLQGCRGLIHQAHIVIARSTATKQSYRNKAEIAAPFGLAMTFYL